MPERTRKPRRERPQPKSISDSHGDEFLRTIRVDTALHSQTIITDKYPDHVRIQTRESEEHGKYRKSLLVRFPASEDSHGIPGRLSIRQIESHFYLQDDLKTPFEARAVLDALSHMPGITPTIYHRIVERNPSLHEEYTRLHA